MSRWHWIAGTIGATMFLAGEGSTIVNWGRRKYWGRRNRLTEMQSPRLVIIGSGWAARLLPGFYKVSIVSPENYFLFTPLLASSAVGTVEYQSLIEPVRRIAQRCQANYICAEAVDVNPKEHFVTCRTLHGHELHVEYDYLVLAVGAEVNTFNTVGVEQNAHFLKRVNDAREIRKRITTNFETAQTPGLDESFRRSLLTTVIVGGGPTGVEFAAELYDLIHEDFPKLYSRETINDARVVVVQSADHILNTYDLKVSQYAEGLFARNGIEVLINARVKEIRPNEVLYTDKLSKTFHSLSNGLCVWATGVRMVPLVRLLSEKIAEQTHDRALIVDNWLRLKGIERGNVFALGDCATIELPSLRQCLDNYFASLNQVGLGDFYVVTRELLKDNPQLQVHLAFLQRLVQRYGTKGQVSKETFQRLVDEVELTLRSLPATAQVASQEGRYLANLFNSMALHKMRNHSTLINYKACISPFIYRHSGMSAYVGAHHAVFDFGRTYLADRFLAFWLWRSIYLNEQVSYRTRLMVAFDWTKTFLFGRDVSTP